MNNGYGPGRPRPQVLGQDRLEVRVGWSCGQGRLELRSGRVGVAARAGLELRSEQVGLSSGLQGRAQAGQRWMVRAASDVQNLRCAVAATKDDRFRRDQS